MTETRYKEVSAIAEGSTCQVFKCRDLLKGKTVAMKKIWIGSECVPTVVIREVSLLKELQHRNIVRLLDILITDVSIDLVFELLDCNLLDFMFSKPLLACKAHQRKKYLYQILDGLAYCHAHNVIHRDLKPENLLIDRRNDIVKLADFGWAKAVGASQKHYTDQVGTYWYAAPEILLNGCQYSTSVDIWSVGCIFAELVNDDILFRGSGKDTQSYAIFSIMGLPDPEMNFQLPESYDTLARVYPQEPKDFAEVFPGLEPSGIDLLRRMLCYDPDKRITASEALEHEYFEDFKNTTCLQQLFYSILVRISNLNASIS